MQNGFTGRIIQQRLSGIASVCPLSRSIRRARRRRVLRCPRCRPQRHAFVNPYADQVTGGYTVKLGNSGLFADFEGIYVKGNDEIVIRDMNWSGNAAGGGRPNPSLQPDQHVYQRRTTRSTRPS